MKIAIKVGLAFGILLLVCSWTTGVLAQEVRREEHPKQLQEVLGLSETQVAAIRAEQQAAGERIHGLRVQVQKLEEQVYQAAEETGDPTTVGKLVLQKIAVQKQIEGEEAGLRAQINSVLTPEQQDKLKQMMEADELFRGWGELLGERRRERPEREVLVPGGGGGGAPGAATRQHRERMPKK